MHDCTSLVYLWLVTMFWTLLLRMSIWERKSIEEIFILKPCSWGRNHFIHPWQAVKFLNAARPGSNMPVIKTGGWVSGYKTMLLWLDLDCGLNSSWGSEQELPQVAPCFITHTAPPAFVLCSALNIHLVNRPTSLVMINVYSLYSFKAVLFIQIITQVFNKCIWHKCLFISSTLKLKICSIIGFNF